jgi:hypothetical protein
MSHKILSENILKFMIRNYGGKLCPTKFYAQKSWDCLRSLVGSLIWIWEPYA